MQRRPGPLGPTSPVEHDEAAAQKDSVAELSRTLLVDHLFVVTHAFVNPEVSH